MNEIQTIKAEKLAEVKKNSKKGFTLIELVVVIAILAILAVIAIPIVSGTITAAQKSSYLNNASTFELAAKEADAMWKANDTSVYGSAPTVDAVLTAKSLTGIETSVTINNTPYTLKWNQTDNKCYYVDASNNDFDNNPVSGTLVSVTVGANPNQPISALIVTNANNNAQAATTAPVTP